MATKPTDGLPRWATGAQAALQAPPGPLMDSGWGFGVKPPHEYFNWWMNNTYRWLQYLDGLQAADLPVNYIPGPVGPLLVNPPTVQTALNIISSMFLHTQDYIQPHTLGLSHVELPDSSHATPDIWSGAAGGLMVNNAPYPYDPGSRTYPVNYAGPYPALDQLDLPDAQNPSGRSGFGAGNVYGNLTINEPCTQTSRSTAYLLRVFGHLRLNARLNFTAQHENPARWLDPSGGHYDQLGTGGAGIMGDGGGAYTLRQSNTTGGPILSFTSGAGAAPDGHHTLFPFLCIRDLRRFLQQAPAAGSVAATLPWLGGGGHAGNSRPTAPGLPPVALGGGVALVLVSGDIIIGSGGALSCDGEKGLVGTIGSNAAGTGGGGGGALLVFCGGRIRSAGSSLSGCFTARGGDGELRTSAYGGGGGGGGLVFLCARNASAAMVDPRGGRGSTGLSSSSTDGKPGSATVIKAIPSLLV